MFQPVNKKLVVEEIPEDNTTQSGIIVPSDDKELRRGVVHAMSEDIEEPIAVGDTILYADIDKDEVDGRKVVNIENVIGRFV